MQKLGIIVPYRDRGVHFNIFVQNIKKYLSNFEYPYELIFVEQSDKKPFNRGKLLNIGVKKAIDLNCTYVALHDIDMIPINVDYSPVQRPTHLATKFISSEKIERRIIYEEYFGGVVLFPISHYLHVNGYSNKYWGWGYEDDDLLFRCKENFIDFNTKKIPSKAVSSTALKFNGYTSSIKIKKKFKLDNYTIFISFCPEEIVCDPAREFDEYSIVSVPGFDTSISYNSFKRYKFETWDAARKNYSLKSDILPSKQTVLCATNDSYNKILRLYQDGKLTDEMPYTNRMMHYLQEKYLYIGLSPSLVHNKRIPFKGTVDYFAIFNHSLEESQIEEISNNINFGLMEAFGNYVAPHTLEICYDMKISTNQKVLDLSGNNRDGEVIDCDRVAINMASEYIEIAVPYRRECSFELLEHKENGFYDNKWNWTHTRKNQLYFFNKVLAGKTNYKRDGIDTLRYKLISDNYINGYHFMSVEI